MPQMGPTCVAVEFFCTECYRLTRRPDSVCALEDGIIGGKEIPAGYKMAQAGWGQTDTLSAVALTAGQLPQGHPARFQVMALLKQPSPYLN